MSKVAQSFSSKNRVFCFRNKNGLVLVCVKQIEIHERYNRRYPCLLFFKTRPWISVFVVFQNKTGLKMSNLKGNFW